MAEEATTYQEKAKRLAALRHELAEAERELKKTREAALEHRKAITRNPTCEAIINRYTLLATVSGLLPTFLNAGALTGLQIKMIDDLAEQFGRNYTEAEGRHTLAALTGGLIAPVVAAPTIASAAVVVPLVGPLVSIVTSPAASAISTGLIGHLALEHFERDEAAALEVGSSGKEAEVATTPH